MSSLVRGGVEVPVIETERLRLRGPRPEDFADSAAMWADLEVTRYIGGKPLTEEDVWGRMLRGVGHWAWRGFGYWVMEEKATGRFAGEMGFSDWEREMEPSLRGVPELGWVLARRVHGKAMRRSRRARRLRGATPISSRRTRRSGRRCASFTLSMCARFVSRRSADSGKSSERRTKASRRFCLPGRSLACAKDVSHLWRFEIAPPYPALTRWANTCRAYGGACGGRPSD
jgi:GNAT acetyltransferase-like protein